MNAPADSLQQVQRLAERGQFAAAESALETLRQAFPQDARVHHASGIMALQRGNSAVAVESLTHALALSPAMASWRRDLGYAFLHAKRFDDAAETFAKVATVAPDHAESWYNLALARSGQRQHDAAREALERALHLSPQQPEILHAYAESLARLERFDEACETWRRLIAAQPRFLAAYLALGQTLMELGRPEEELELLNSALRHLPDSPELLSCAAKAREDFGDAAGAEAAYRRALSLRPQGQTLGRLLRLLGRRAEPGLVAHAQQVMGDSRTSDTVRAAVGYGLGKIFSEQGHHRQAFATWHDANAARRRDAGAMDRNALRQRVDALIATFDADFFARHRGWGNPDERPVFVVGVPRSGTTLVEQIIAAHPLGAGAGELPHIPRLSEDLPERFNLPGAWPESANRLTEAQVTDVAAEYIRALARFAGPHSVRIIDKTPANFFHVGLIRLLFPRAHILWCQRDPRDACLSIYTEDFAPTQRHATDLVDVALYYQAHERIMSHWQRLMPTAIHPVRYEDLVTNTEQTSRAMLQFLRLDWAPECLHFHQRQRAVSTPSRWQVRQPVHARSIGRWKTYRPWLGPLLDTLKPSA